MVNLLTLRPGKPGDAASPFKRNYQESLNQSLTLSSSHRQKPDFRGNRNKEEKLNRNLEGVRQTSVLEPSRLSSA